MQGSVATNDSGLTPLRLCSVLSGDIQGRDSNITRDTFVFLL